MPGIIDRIARLLHRAERQPADECLLLRSFNLLQQLLQFLRVHFIRTDMERIAKIIDKRRKLLDLLRVRIFMRSIHERKLPPIKIRSNRLICGKHEILDDLRCHIAFIWPDVDRIALCIKDHLRLRKIKVDRAALHTLFP